jgi:TetR/AcrR family transcriptional repressor of nem operon
MMPIMRNAPGRRRLGKQQSLDRILDSAARRLREEGIEGAAIAPVMRDAGLTHGAFYAHFDTKQDLANRAFAHAITTGRSRWIRPGPKEPWNERLKRLARRYLTPAHRDDLATACGFAALISEAARAPNSFRQTYQRELQISLAAVCNSDESDERMDDAIALAVICFGGIALARAVPDDEFSARVLRVAREAAATYADHARHRGN